MKLSDIKNNAIHVPNSTKSNEKLNIIIVNTENNGKRIKFSKSLLNELGNTNFIDIYIEDKNVYFVPDENGSKINKGGILYNSNAVNMITEALKLDFSDKTSQSISVKIIKDENTDEKYATVTND